MNWGFGLSTFLRFFLPLLAVIAFNQCSPLEPLRAPAGGHAQSSGTGNAEGYEGKLYAERLPFGQCPDESRTNVLVGVLSPTEGLLYRENCADVRPARSVALPRNCTQDGVSYAPGAVVNHACAAGQSGQIVRRCESAGTFTILSESCGAGAAQAALKYTWQSSAFGACANVSCNSAAQTRTVRCQDEAGNNVADANCPAAARPAQSQSCAPVGSACLNTLNFPVPVVWRTSGAVCMDYGYISDTVNGQGSPCASAGALSLIHWASALPQPNGCPAGQATGFTNTYVCKFCPSGRWRSVNRDVNIAPATYPSGWQTPAHTIPAQPELFCD